MKLLLFIRRVFQLAYWRVEFIIQLLFFFLELCQSVLQELDVF